MILADYKVDPNRDISRIVSLGPCHSIAQCQEPSGQEAFGHKRIACRALALVQCAIGSQAVTAMDALGLTAAQRASSGCHRKGDCESEGGRIGMAALVSRRVNSINARGALFLALFTRYLDSTSPQSAGCRPVSHLTRVVGLPASKKMGSARPAGWLGPRHAEEFTLDKALALGPWAPRDCGAIALGDNKSVTDRRCRFKSFDTFQERLAAGDEVGIVSQNIRHAIE